MGSDTKNADCEKSTWIQNRRPDGDMHEEPRLDIPARVQRLIFEGTGTCKRSNDHDSDKWHTWADCQMRRGGGREGDHLEDDRTFSSYNIPNMSTLNFMKKQSRGCRRIRRLLDETERALEV